MTTSVWTAGTVSVGLALLVGWALPALGMRALMPALERSRLSVPNYRGREVPVALGLVWVLWAVGLWTMTVVIDGLESVLAMTGALQTAIYPDALREAAWLAPVLLVIAVFVFGLVDDILGGAGAKGYRGHIDALRHGRLTTGGLKMIGIGLASLAAVVEPALRRTIDAAGDAMQPRAEWLVVLAGWLLGAAVVALAANLVNLTDLRPGRALKTYTVLALLAVAAVVPWALRAATTAEEQVPSGAAPVAEAVLTALVLAILLLGPVFAVWRYDLTERGMLGDAGANAAGALAGFVLAATLPIWGLAVAAALLLALNLASEKVSFSAVIERFGFLRWLDGLGGVRDGVDAVTDPRAESTHDMHDTNGAAAAVDTQRHRRGGTVGT